MKNKKLKLIEKWLYDFPCDKFFPKNDSCIHEFVTPHEMLEFLTKQKREHDNYLIHAKWIKVNVKRKQSKCPEHPKEFLLSVPGMGKYCPIENCKTYPMENL